MKVPAVALGSALTALGLCFGSGVSAAELSVHDMMQ